MDKTQERIEQYMKENKLELAGHVHVNVGTVLIVDPSEVLNDVKYQEFMNLYDSKDDGKSHHEIFKGVESRTGYGDGAYPVFVSKDDDGRVMEIRIRFDISYGFDEKGGPMKYFVMDELWNTLIERDAGKNPLA